MVVEAECIGASEYRFHPAGVNDRYPDKESGRSRDKDYFSNQVQLIGAVTRWRVYID